MSSGSDTQLAKRRRLGNEGDDSTTGGVTSSSALGTLGAPASETSTSLDDAGGLQRHAPQQHQGRPNNMDPMAYDNKTPPEDVPVKLLPQFAQMVLDPNQPSEVTWHGALMIRKLLSVQTGPPIDAIINAGVVRRLVKLLARDDCREVQLEACWALTNIASGTSDNTRSLIQHGAVENILRLLCSPSEEVREQAIWAIGNIAGDGLECRDHVIQQGAIAALLACVAKPTSNTSVLRNAAWALSNVVRARPLPPAEVLAPSLPVLAGLLIHQDSEVVIDACWALSYMSDGPQDRVQSVLDLAIIPRVVQLLTAPSTAAMQRPAIRIIGNVAAGSDLQTQVIVNCGALNAFPFLLAHANRTIRKETCWALSNITAGSVDQIQAVIDARLFPEIMKCMGDTELEVRKEAVWTIANATSGGTKEQIRYLVEAGVLEPLCSVLDMFDVKVITVALEAIENILLVGEDFLLEQGLQTNPIVDMLTRSRGLEKIEALQMHGQEEVSGRAVSLLEEFFATPSLVGQPLAISSSHVVDGVVNAFSSRTYVETWWCGARSVAAITATSHQGAGAAGEPEGRLAACGWLATVPCVAAAFDNLHDRDSREMWKVCSQLLLPAGFDAGVILVCVRWKDQGWGNLKGEMRIGDEPQNALTPGTTAQHHETSVRRLYIVPHTQQPSTLVSPLKSSTDSTGQQRDLLAVKYKVGGGGGHELLVPRFRCIVLPRQGTNFYELLHILLKLKSMGPRPIHLNVNDTDGDDNNGHQLRQQQEPRASGAIASSSMAAATGSRPDSTTTTPTTSSATPAAEDATSDTSNKKDLIRRCCMVLPIIPLATICQFILPVNLERWFTASKATTTVG